MSNGPRLVYRRLTSRSLQLMTGHVDGSMSQWHALPERVGAAFGVAGFGGAVRESSTDMHWHAHPVNCMDIASDGCVRRRRR